MCALDRLWLDGRMLCGWSFVGWSLFFPRQCTPWDCSAFLAQQDRLVRWVHSAVFLCYILLQQAPTAALWG